MPLRNWLLILGLLATVVVAGSVLYSTIFLAPDITPPDTAARPG